MAVIRQITAQRGIDVGGTPNTRVDDGIGQGLRAAGGAIADAGQVAQHMAMRRERMAMEMQEFETDQAFRRFNDDNGLEFSKAQLDIAPSGQGFTENVSSTFNQRADEFLKTVPDALKPKFSELVLTAREQWVNRAAATEIDQRNTWYRDGITKAHEKLQGDVFNDPSLFQAAKDDGYRAIDASGLPQTEKQALREGWDRTLSATAVERDIRTNPEGVMNSLGLARVADGANQRMGYLDVAKQFIGANENTDGKAIAEFIKRACGISVDPKQTAWCAAFVNGVLGSEGRGGTGSLAARSFLDYGTETKEPKIGDVVVLSRGANPQFGHVGFYAGRGADGKIKILGGNQGNAVSVAEFDEGRVLSYRRPPEAKTGEQAQANLAQMPGGAMQGGIVVTSLDPRFASLPLADRLKAFDRAEAEQKRLAGERQAQTRSMIDLAVNNAPYAIQNTGEYSGYMPTFDDFQTAYGEAGGQKYASFLASVDTSKAAFQMQSMSAGDIASLVNSARPMSSGDDAALQTARYETLVKAAEQTLKAREANPSTYVSKQFPHVAEAWSNASGGNYQEAIAKSFAAQTQLGIRDVQPLPKQVADDAVAKFKDGEQNERSRIEAVASILMATNDPEQRRAIFNQMVKAGLPEITEGAFVALERGEEGAARRLFQAAMTDPSKLPGKAPETPDAINNQIQADLMDAGQVGDVYYGLSNGSVENFERAQRDAKLLVNAVNLRVRNGESLSDAVTAAGKDLYGDVKVVEGGWRVNAQVLVPSDESGAAVIDRLASSLPKIRAALEQTMAVPQDASVADGTKAVMETARKNRIDDIMAQGFFRNMGDGYAFIDPYTGAAIAGADGRPVVIGAGVSIEAIGDYIGSLVAPAANAAPTSSVPVDGASPAKARQPESLRTDRRNTPAGQIKEQRQQLFKDARDFGPLSLKDAMSGNDPLFGER